MTAFYPKRVEKWYRKVCTGMRHAPGVSELRVRNIQKVHDILLKPLNRVCEQQQTKKSAHNDQRDKMDGKIKRVRECDKKKAVDTLFDVRQMCIENKKKTSFQWLNGWSASRKSWNVQCCRELVGKACAARSSLLTYCCWCCCFYIAFSWMKRQATGKKSVHTISLCRNFRTLQKHMLTHSVYVLSWIEFGVQGCLFFCLVTLLVFFSFFLPFAIVQALVDMLLPCAFPKRNAWHSVFWYGLVWFDFLFAESWVPHDKHIER